MSPSHLRSSLIAAARLLTPTGPPPNERLRPMREALAKLPADIPELSELDVMNVLAIVRKDFNVDPSRIYLWGHSMGGGGAESLSWAASL